MGNFILGVLIPLPCDDPVAYVEEAMLPYAGEGNRADGWEILELRGSQHVDAAPGAYIAVDGSGTRARTVPRGDRALGAPAGYLARDARALRNE